MRASILTIVLIAQLVPASCLRAQTTGVPFVNDLTITCAGCGSGYSNCWIPGTTGGPGGISGGTSKELLFFEVSAGGTFTIMVTCAPGSQVHVFMSPVPCLTCSLALAPVCGIPVTACGLTTNQSVDLDLASPLDDFASGASSASGVFSFTTTLAPMPFGLCIEASIQAAIIGPASSCAPLLVSQAYYLGLGG
jgi:hypothetical protein